ncbi:oxygenase MpaB family protein [Arthrobacter sp. SIMBA_036]|uniref:oxygenase MpaB family protein n=1 Tax=Arthrobacter sp. SIMBA_036 TaxID=3085778 RepID=UPI00397E0418
MKINDTLAMSLRGQQTAPPSEWESTFRQMVLFDLAADTELGFFLAYYRNFAIPSIAATLCANAEIQLRPMKRSYDTAIVIYELISCGLDSDRGRTMVELLNRIHRHVPGSTDDFLYVLLTLLVVPIRWIREHAWRQPTASELAAAHRFFMELGVRMNMTCLPASYSEAEDFFDLYEATHVASSTEGRLLMASTVRVFRNRLPVLLRPLAKQLISTMLDDDRLTDALGLPHASPASRTILRTGLTARNAIQRRRRLKTKPHFAPGFSGSSLYPRGYSLERIGPVNVPPFPMASGNELP